MTGEGGGPHRTEVPTRAEALARAARMLEFAEGETDLAKMERFTELGGEWIQFAFVLGDTGGQEEGEPG